MYKYFGSIMLQIMYYYYLLLYISYEMNKLVRKGCGVKYNKGATADLRVSKLCIIIRRSIG